MKQIDLLEKKLKKYKIMHIFIIIIVFGICNVFLWGYLYLHKDVLSEKKIWKKLQSYRNTIQRNYNYDYKYVENNHNAAYKLNLISAYGDNQPYHPKIINFKSKWNGYKYWMVFSPFPYGEEKYENPNILVSNDKINWEEPKGFKNPIEDTPTNFKEDLNYNSDPHIVYNDDTDCLELFWRFVYDEKNEVIVYHKSTKDGIHWTEKGIVLKADRTKKDYISPAIIYENGVYKWWFVDKKRTIKYMESKDGNNTFSKETVIDLEYPIPGLTSWHIDVIKTEKGYEMLTVAYRNWKDRNSMNLYYFSSEDNNRYSKGIIILRPSLISWDNRGIYRSSFIYENGVYYVFYSGISNQMERGIGMSYGEHIENLVGSNIKAK